MSVHTLDSVYTVWHEALQEAVSTRHSLLFKRNALSFDRSIDPFEKGSISAFRTNPAVAAIQYNVYVVWSGLLQSSNRAILYTRSTDGGANFGSTVSLSNTTGPSTFPAIAVSGNNVHVVWHDNSPGNNNISYKRSIDGGANFPSNFFRRLSDSSSDSSDPAIAVSGNKVHVVWHDNSLGNNNIFYTRSIDDGANFDRTVRLSDTFDSTAPAIAASGNNVYVVWVADLTPDSFFTIFYRRSIDDGANFSEATFFSQDIEGDSTAPAIAASGNKVHVVRAVKDTTGKNNIFYKRSTDDGANFSTSVNLSDPVRDSTAPAIAASGNNVYVVWVGLSNNLLLDIFYARSTDDGANFGSSVNLSNVTFAGGTATPAIAASNNLII